MNATAPVLLPHTPGAPEGDAPVCWRVLIRAAGEPLLLSRVLQKITVPEIELRSVHFETGAPGAGARVELTLLARPARARLAAARIEKLIGVREVTLEPRGAVMGGGAR